MDRMQNNAKPDCRAAAKDDRTGVILCWGHVYPGAFPGKPNKIVSKNPKRECNCQARYCRYEDLNKPIQPQKTKALGGRID